MWVLITIGLLAVVLTLGVMLILVNLKKKSVARAEQPNYRVFFIVGGVMLAVGTAEMLILLRSDIPYVVALPLLAIGLVFVLIGLANRDKWGKL